VARINLTIPDPLYERLDRLRDRVNVSKVCAIALAKELDMVEGNATLVANPKAQRMIERLQGMKARKDRWFQQGYEDGENWAAELAEPSEIRSVLDEWDLDEDERYKINDVEFPESFDQKAAIKHWIEAEAHETGSKAGGPGTLSETEQDAYLRGWNAAIRDIWKAAGPALRWVAED
jgi:hypothetical protein